MIRMEGHRSNRKGPGGRSILGLKVEQPRSVAPVLRSIELSDTTPEAREVQDWALALMNSATLWTNARMRDGVADDGNRIGKGEASRRLHRELNRLAAGGGK